MSDSRIYHFHNSYHLGDCILSLKFFYNIRNILHDKQICIYFYYNQDYLKQLIKEIEYYAYPDVIILLPNTQQPHTSYDLWMGNDLNNINYKNWELYFEEQYKNIIRYLQLEDCRIDYSLWQPEEYLLERYQTLPDAYQLIDILIINSTPYSFQYEHDPKEMDDLCIFLNKSYSVVTTRKVEGIRCTMDMGLRIQDIAAIATHCKYIIAIHTGPLCPLFNKQTKETVKKWFFIVTHGHHYICHNIDYDMIGDGNLNGIYQYFKDKIHN